MNYDSSDNLTTVEKVTGTATAVVTTAASATATVTFTFTGYARPPAGILIYAYQAAANIYNITSINSTFTSRSMPGGGTSGSPTAFSTFDANTHTMTIGLPASVVGTLKALSKPAHCYVEFVLSTV